jgi:hypothetical protein
MSNKPLLRVASWLLAAGVVIAQAGDCALPQAVSPPQSTVACRVMEVFVAERVGATAVIFHQRDKADGPRLGDLLVAHSGEEVEFQTSDGRWHRATVVRIRSCFGRGMLLFRLGEARLTEKQEFVLRFGT